MATGRLLALIAEAHTAQIEIGRDGHGALTLRAPQNAVALAQRLRERQADVMRLFDWTHAELSDPAPCALCQRPAMLRDPVERRPCHKVCLDRLLSPTRRPRTRRAERIAA